MPLLNLGNRRSSKAGNDGDIGKLDYRIGNPIVGQGVFLTGTERPIDTTEGIIEYDDFESVTVSTLAVGLTESKAVGHDYALITNEVAAVRFRVDAAPTATSGHELGVGDILRLKDSVNLDRIQFISRDGGSATLRVSYGNRR